MDLNSVNITATQVAKNYFSAYVENGFIYSYSVYGERQHLILQHLLLSLFQVINRQED